MKFCKQFTFLFLLICTLPAFGAFTSPLGMSLIPWFQFPHQDSSVAGLRINIWGKNKNVYGLDFGAIANQSAKSFIGVQVAGGINRNIKATVTGFQLAGILNNNASNTHIVGLQAALINWNGKGHQLGFQIGALNFSGDMNIYGIQVGGLNKSDTLVGMQVGLINMASSVYGFQIGLINRTSALTGIQIGLINMGGGLLPFIPILNIGFI